MWFRAVPDVVAGGGPRLLAPFGRESAAGQFAGAYADMHALAVTYPEVPDAVRALARRVRIAVVANADHDYLMRCLNHNRLRFNLVVDSETAGCYKPDPRIFQRACDALAVPAGETVMVGDTPETDVQGAHRAGLRAVWLNRDQRMARQPRPSRRGHRRTGTTSPRLSAARPVST